MNNTSYPLPLPAQDPTQTHCAPLISSFGGLRNQMADAIYRVDHLAMLSGDHGLRCYLNSLGTGLEIFAAQLEFHFPDGCREVDLDEWTKILAVLNSASGWIEDQLLEIHRHLGSDKLSEQIQHLAHSYSAIVPEVIAARFERGEPKVASDEPTWTPRPTTPVKTNPSLSGMLAFSH